MQIETGIVQIVPFPGPYGIVLKAFCTLSVQFIVNSIFSAPKKITNKSGPEKKDFVSCKDPRYICFKGDN